MLPLLFQQKERLCGQHCLNNLLQGPYFGPAELSDLAQIIDNQERAQMAECGTETESYREFLKVYPNNVQIWKILLFFYQHSYYYRHHLKMSTILVISL